jgi:hypothetical protein
MWNGKPEYRANRPTKQTALFPGDAFPLSTTVPRPWSASRRRL